MKLTARQEKIGLEFVKHLVSELKALPLAEQVGIGIAWKALAAKTLSVEQFYQSLSLSLRTKIVGAAISVHNIVTDTK